MTVGATEVIITAISWRLSKMCVVSKAASTLQVVRTKMDQFNIRQTLIRLAAGSMILRSDIIFGAITLPGDRNFA